MVCENSRRVLTRSTSSFVRRMWVPLLSENLRKRSMLDLSDPSGSQGVYKRFSAWPG